MSEELLIRHCAPTMANIKTANLFSGLFENRRKMLDEVRSLNSRLKDKGIRVLALKYAEGRGLIYVYRPSRLCKDFSDTAVCDLLYQRGYCTENCEKCVVELMKRIRQSEDFPHEIGLFLGYPCEDVRGFIENKASCFKCVGCWKVYGDADKAQKQFERFKKCTRVYQKQYESGRPLTRLTVSK